MIVDSKSFNAVMEEARVVFSLAFKSNSNNAKTNSYVVINYLTAQIVDPIFGRMLLIKKLSHMLQANNTLI